MAMLKPVLFHVKHLVEGIGDWMVVQEHTR
jgi:hypothetical protein